MSANAPQPAQGTLGTFGGVFTPSILTILGLVLFLLVPFVVGSVGLFQALLILGLSTLVSVLTSISLATVCLLYTSPSPRDLSTSRMPSSA